MSDEIAEARAEVERLRLKWYTEIDHFRARVVKMRGLLAECLALNPIVSGDMEKMHVWADVLRRMKKEASDE